MKLTRKGFLKALSKRRKAIGNLSQVLSKPRTSRSRRVKYAVKKNYS